MGKSIGNVSSTATGDSGNLRGLGTTKRVSLVGIRVLRETRPATKRESAIRSPKNRVLAGHRTYSCVVAEPMHEVVHVRCVLET